VARAIDINETHGRLRLGEDQNGRDMDAKKDERARWPAGRQWMPVSGVIECGGD
jgi:hypothetical protein